MEELRGLLDLYFRDDEETEIPSESKNTFENIFNSYYNEDRYITNVFNEITGTKGSERILGRGSERTISDSFNKGEGIRGVSLNDFFYRENNTKDNNNKDYSINNEEIHNKYINDLKNYKNLKSIDTEEVSEASEQTEEKAQYFPGEASEDKLHKFTSKNMPNVLPKHFSDNSGEDLEYIEDVKNTEAVKYIEETKDSGENKAPKKIKDKIKGEYTDEISSIYDEYNMKMILDAPDHNHNNADSLEKNMKEAVKETEHIGDMDPYSIEEKDYFSHIPSRMNIYEKTDKPETAEPENADLSYGFEIDENSSEYENTYKPYSEDLKYSDHTDNSVNKINDLVKLWDMPIKEEQEKVGKIYNAGDQFSDRSDMTYSLNEDIYATDSRMGDSYEPPFYFERGHGGEKDLSAVTEYIENDSEKADVGYLGEMLGDFFGEVSGKNYSITNNISPTVNLYSQGQGIEADIESIAEKIGDMLAEAAAGGAEGVYR